MNNILNLLKKHYPDPKCALRHRSALQLLVATILSAQCTDKRVNLVTPALFKRYRNAKDFAEADIKELEKMVRSTGFYRNKAKNIKSACKNIVEDFKGKVPSNMKDLITLPGVARKTANCVLSVWYKKNVGIVVDTHVKRLSQRWHFTKHKDPNKIEKDLMKIVPKKEWEAFSLRTIQHGRLFCKSQKPLCKDCFLNKICPSAFNV